MNTIRKITGRTVCAVAASSLALSMAACGSDSDDASYEDNGQTHNEAPETQSSNTATGREQLIQQVNETLTEYDHDATEFEDEFFDVASSFACAGVNFEQGYGAKSKAYNNPLSITGNNENNSITYTGMPIFSGKVSGHQYTSYDGHFNSWNGFNNLSDDIEEYGNYLRENAAVTDASGSLKDKSQKFLMFSIPEGYEELDTRELSSLSPSDLMTRGCGGDNSIGPDDYKINRNAASEQIEDVSYTFKGVFAMTAEELGLDPEEFRTVEGIMRDNGGSSEDLAFDNREGSGSGAGTWGNALREPGSAESLRFEIQDQEVLERFADAYKAKLDEGIDQMPEVTVTLDVQHAQLSVSSTDQEWWTGSDTDEVASPMTSTEQRP